MIFLLCLLTRALSAKELAGLHGDWKRLRLKQGVPVLYLFILNIPDSRPGPLMQRKGERNRKRSCYISLFHKAVLLSWMCCQQVRSRDSLGSRGEQWGDRRKMNGEKGFALKPCIMGKVFVSGPARIAFHTLHALLLVKSILTCVKVAWQFISAEVLPTGQRQITPRLCQALASPPRSLSSGLQELMLHPSVLSALWYVHGLGLLAMLSK